MLVYTVDEWRSRTRSLIIKGLARSTLILIYSYFIGTIVFLLWAGLLEDGGNLF